MVTLPKMLQMLNTKRTYIIATYINTKKLVLTLTTTILSHMWKTRNRLKFDDTIIPTTNTIMNIKNDLKDIIQTHCKKHAINNTTHKFENNFGINNALCTIKKTH